jgi:hypothetical protein
VRVVSSVRFPRRAGSGLEVWKGTTYGYGGSPEPKKLLYYIDRIDIDYSFSIWIKLEFLSVRWAVSWTSARPQTSGILIDVFSTSFYRVQFFFHGVRLESYVCISVFYRVDARLSLM